MHILSNHLQTGLVYVFTSIALWTIVANATCTKMFPNPAPISKNTSRSSIGPIPRSSSSSLVMPCGNISPTLRCGVLQSLVTTTHGTFSKMACTIVSTPALSPTASRPLIEASLGLLAVRLGHGEHLAGGADDSGELATAAGRGEVSAGVSPVGLGVGVVPAGLVVGVGCAGLVAGIDRAGHGAGAIGEKLAAGAGGGGVAADTGRG
ncbi:unnamed protein product [Phytophthora fragariaefolia]|uniref:Unnamed protein product n=1 Tax=Phytophthora fragariaefolia TaxID=1490495 RepID=A0A9W6XZB8_9STRA|nr:unnamed protein product [Phytophthora fragariaefolia]